MRLPEPRFRAFDEGKKARAEARGWMAFVGSAWLTSVV